LKAIGFDKLQALKETVAVMEQMHRVVSDRLLHASNEAETPQRQSESPYSLSRRGCKRRQRRRQSELTFETERE